MKYIGIDFGDGTTSASLLETDKDNNSRKNEYGEPCPPDVKNIMNQGVSGDKTEVPSIIAYPIIDKTRDVLIGTMAGEASGLEYESRSNWKTQPTRPETVPGYSYDARVEDTKRFMATIWKLYKETNSQQNANVRIVIGVPSGWNGKSSDGRTDREIYCDYAKVAGLPNVTALSESTAAFLYSRKFLTTSDGNRISDQALENGLLLIDVGSSTIDFSYAKGLQLSQPYGVPIGAKYIDNAILQYNIDSLGAVAENVRKIVSADNNKQFRSRAEFCCRQLKEKYFNLARKSNGGPVSCPDVKSVSAGEAWIDLHIYDNPLTRTVSPKLWDALLEAGCSDSCKVIGPSGVKVAWRVAFREALNHVKDNIVKEENVKDLTIVLTGGASRMDFVDKDVRSVFEEATLLAGSADDRSFSVSQGLAWAGYAQDKIKTVADVIPKKIMDYMKADEVREKIISGVLLPFAKVISRSAAMKLADEIESNSSNLNTINKQQSRYQELVSAYAREEIAGENFKKQLQDVCDGLLCNNVITSMTEDVHKEFSRVSICNRTVSNISSAGLSLEVDLKWTLANAGLSGFSKFVNGLFAILTLGLGVLLRKVLQNPDNELTREFMKETCEKLKTESLQRDIARAMCDSLCKNKSRENVEQLSMFDAVRNVISGAIIGTKQDEIRALAGQFVDA